MAEVKSIGTTYEKRPGLFRSSYSWEQSNAIMEDVISAVLGVYGEAHVSRQRSSSLDKNRCVSAVADGHFFEVVLEYVAREGNDKDKVVARLRPRGPVNDKFTRLDEVVRQAMK